MEICTRRGGQRPTVDGVTAIAIRRIGPYRKVHRVGNVESWGFELFLLLLGGTLMLFLSFNPILGLTAETLGFVGKRHNTATFGLNHLLPSSASPRRRSSFRVDIPLRWCFDGGSHVDSGGPVACEDKVTQDNGGD